MAQKDYGITLLKTGDMTRSIYETFFRSTQPPEEIDPSNFRSPELMGGIQHVAQMYIKFLLTTKGTDAFDQSLGAGLAAYLRYSASPDDPIFEMEVSRRITDAADQITARQVEQQVDDDVKFQSASLVGIFDENGETVIAIRVEAADGNSIDITVPPPNTSRLVP